MLAPREERVSNVEAEAAIVGALMQDNKQVDTVADKLEADDFFDPIMRRVYSTILREHSLGRSAGPSFLIPHFAGDELMAQVGGSGFLATLTEHTTHTIGLRDFVEQVAELAARRRLITGLQETIELAEDYEATRESLIEAADAAIAGAMGTKEDVHQPTAGDCVKEALAMQNQPAEGVECGCIPSLDRLLGPIRPKQLVILAARPGVGKTAVALSYSIGAARSGHGVLFVSLEMGSTELGARMAADACFRESGDGVPFAAINTGRMSNEDARKVSRAADEISAMPFRVIDVGSITIGRLSMMVRRYKRRMAAAGKKLELVVVDYLQLVQPDQHRKSNYEAVSEVSRGLKAIAKTHDVGVLALAQLSREVEKRPDKRPQLSDLRDSGQIEQDADAVLFLLREEYYLRKEEPSETSPERAKWEASLAEVIGKIEFSLAKRRNGKEGRAEGLFSGKYQAVR